MHASRWSLERSALALGMAALAAGPVWVGLRAIGVSAGVAVVVSGGLLAALAIGMSRRLPRALDGCARRRPRAALLVALLWLGGAASVLRIAPFMADPESTWGAPIPDNDFYLHHDCATAYVRAAELARAGVANLYETEQYTGTVDGDPRQQIGRFAVDPYEYPPPFLLPVRAAIALTDDFTVIRAGWFTLEAALFAAAVIGLAIWLRGRDGVALGLLAPAVLASVPVLGTLAVGNFQLAAYALAVLAMLAVERDRDALAGALLAFAIVAKLFPGLLLVLLVARSRWRAVGWTAAFAALYAGLALAVLGTDPFRAFISYQLPRMADGSAFPFLAGFPPATAVNHAVFGLIFKLRLVGVPAMTTGVAGALAWIYTGAVVAFAYVRGRKRRGSRLGEAMLWLVLLQLGALRSPFTPDLYALVLPVWMLVLLAVRAAGPARAAIAAAWLAIGAAVLFLPVTAAANGAIPMGAYLLLTGAAQLLGFAVVTAAISLDEAAEHGSAR